MTTSLHEDLLDTLATAVLRLDRAGRVRYLNPAAADLFETSPGHARGKTLTELLPVDEHFVGYVRRAVAGGEPLALAELELHCGPPPGRKRRVACDILPLDAGDAVQLELQALDRRRLITPESGSGAGAQLPRQLFQALAHEIKNPLSGLRGAAQLMAAETSDPALREYLDILLRETARLRDLVDSLLGPARPPRLVSCNIHEVLEHVRQLLAPTACKGVGWVRDYDPSLPELVADPDQLTQVFLNLVGNALEAVGASGEIRVRTRVERHYVSGDRRGARPAIRVDVEDDGPGVPEDLRASLFLPLVTGRADGTGLGLPIAQQIVQAHGGVIDWKSEPRHTVFSVILPLRPPARGADTVTTHD